jgi:hypothetical protein
MGCKPKDYINPSFYGRNFVNNQLQSRIPFYLIANYQNANQVIASLILKSVGVSTKIIVLVCLFL